MEQIKLIISATMRTKIYQTSLVALLLLMTASTMLVASEKNVSKASNPEMKVIGFFKNSSYTIENTTETNFQRLKAKHSAANSTAFTFVHPFLKTTTGAVFQVSKELTGKREFAIGDSVLFASGKLLSLHKRVSLNGSSSALIPLSESSRDVLGLRTALTVGPSLSIDFGGLGLKYLKMGLGASITKYFYKYKINSNGKYNTDYKTKYSASLSYSPKSWFSVSYAFVVQERERYNNLVTDPVFSNTLTFASTLTDKFSIALGLSDSGAVYKENGIDNNVKIFDNESGSAFFTMSYSL